MFSTNIGAIDRIGRLVIGIALILGAALGYIGLWGYIGIIPLVTALVRWCPLYTLLGLNTGKK